VSAAPETVLPVRIDLGAGKNPKAGFVGVDRIDFGNGNVICNIGTDRWPWDDSSVDEAHSAHTLEHLTNFEERWERVHFFNELHRVLKPRAKCQLIFPHWASNRYYGDPTHKEPFSEMGFYYLDRGWRKKEAPHTDNEFNPNGYLCDFLVTYGYALHPQLLVRNSEYQQHAMTFWKDSCQDIIATLEARK
jgi:Methyltransferase domain.